MRKIILGLLSVLTLVSCNDDLEIYSTPQNLPYVYGLLTTNENVQYIHVTKTFQKNANEVSIDDLYYHDDSVSIFLDKFVDDNLVESWDALPVITSDKDSGIFPFPYNKYYKIELATPLSAFEVNSTYSIRIEPTNTVNHVTNIKPFSLSKNIEMLKPKISHLTPANEIKFISGVSTYSPFVVRWNHVGGGKENGVLTFKIQEINQTTSEVDTIEVAYSFFDGYPDAGGNEVEAKIELSDIYFRIGSQLKKDPNITRRMLRTENATVGADRELRGYGVGIEVWSSSRDFSTYQSVIFSNDGISQDKPNFTNLVNGLGVYTTRSKFIQTPESEKLFFGQSVLDSLACSTRFFDYNFAKMEVNQFEQLIIDDSPGRCN